MVSLFFLGFAGFVFTLILTPLVRNWAHRVGLVDHPDEARKLHRAPIARFGGVAIFLGYLLSYGAIFLARLSSVHQIEGGLPLAVRLFPAVLVVFGIGVVDDIWSLRPWQKFAGQTLASVIVYLAGVHVTGFGGFALPVWLSLPATIFWLVLCTNAINLIDGVDGLAAGVGIFAASTTLLAALLQHNLDLALALAPLIGCLLGFLRYNFNPATIFLGDSGSLVIGFFLGCCSIIWTQKSATILGMTAPLLALSIPLLDTFLAIVRRFLRGKPIFMADRDHIHHRLLNRGLTHRGVSLIIYGFCALSAILALSLTYKGFEGLVIVLFCAATWIGVQHLGYVEFGVAGKMVLSGAFGRHLNTNVALRTLELRLRAANTPEECWHVVHEGAKDFGFLTIEMSIAGRHYKQRFKPSAAGAWTVRIPLSDFDFVELTREFDTSSEHCSVAPFADSVRRILEPKFRISLPLAHWEIPAVAVAARE